MNRITLTGIAGRDAENKGKITAFTVACRTSKDANGDYATTWFDVATLGDCNVRKGDRVLVEGRFEPKEHNGKTYLNIFAQVVEVLQKRDRRVNDLPEDL